MTITDRLRFSVIEANTNNILARDLVVKEPRPRANLSAPSTIQFKMDQTESVRSSSGINWKNWGLYIVCEIEIDGIRQVYAYGMVTDNRVDPESGDLSIQATGVMGYAKNTPLLVNYNPIAVDPFEIIQLIWAHLQSFSNANLGVGVTPASSGTQMLPGYSYDGNILNFDFFAVFYRASDLLDCGDIITGLARDIPFDMIEEAEWNDDRTELIRNIRLGYPQGGVQQENLVFRFGENVIKAEKAEEMDIEPVSDVIIRGWLPGKVYSSELSNADPTRFRRVILEEDAYIDSTERAAAWAKRKLTRRNIPLSFQKIVIDANHSHAPLGSFWVGDSIYVEAKDYPWYGDIEGWHRVTYIEYDEEKSLAEIGLKVDGAFNYDPIEYDPDYDQQPTTDENRLANGYFASNLIGWISEKGQWIRTTIEQYQTVYVTSPGAVRIDCDDHGEAFRSHAAHCTPGEHLRLQCVVKYNDVTLANNIQPTFQLIGIPSFNGDTSVAAPFVIDQLNGSPGTVGWQQLKMDDWEVPPLVNEISLRFNVTAAVTDGTAFWTYARVVPSDSPGVPT
jgi:hypothetical protein